MTMTMTMMMTKKMKMVTKKKTAMKKKKTKKRKMVTKKKMVMKKTKMVDPKPSSSTASANFSFSECPNCKMVDLKPLSSAASENVSLLKCVKLDGKKKLPQLNPAASKFMSVFASDDILLEIFLRLPNGRSATQLATVCNRWHSLIIDEQFKTRLNLYHLRKQSLDSSYHPAYTNSTILYRFTDRYDEGHCYEVSSKQYQPKLYDTSFMPNWEKLIIRATNGYLLLLSDRSVRQYFICNTLTRLWLKLPAMPAELALDDVLFPFHYDSMIMPGTHGFALVCNPLDIAENRYRYKVVIVNKCYFFSNKYSFNAAIYDSETGLWTQPSFSSSLPYNMGQRSHQRLYSNVDLVMVVSSNGVLHWVDGVDDGKGCVFVFDPSSLFEQVKAVGFPQEHFGNSIYDYPCGEVRLGLVRGRIRLSRTEGVQGKGGRFLSLKIWELDSNCFSWQLVHYVVFKDMSSVDFKFCLLAFDPNDENALILVSFNKVYRYEIDQGKYQLICGFSVRCDYFELKVFTILHPLWPTPTLSLASTKQF